eukprot:SAG31_NODE_2007_length_6678_cov_3.061864_2_plen_208_part_00
MGIELALSAPAAAIEGATIGYELKQLFRAESALGSEGASTALRQKAQAALEDQNHLRYRRLFEEPAGALVHHPLLILPEHRTHFVGTLQPKIQSQLQLQPPVRTPHGPPSGQEQALPAASAHSAARQVYMQIELHTFIQVAWVRTPFNRARCAAPPGGRALRFVAVIGTTGDEPWSLSSTGTYSGPPLHIPNCGDAVRAFRRQRTRC